LVCYGNFCRNLSANSVYFHHAQNDVLLDSRWKERFTLSVTARQAWVGFLILFLVVLLVLVAALYWHHVTDMNLLHLLAYVPGPIGQGC
jgi:hypothetical protein